METIVVTNKEEGTVAKSELEVAAPSESKQSDVNVKADEGDLPTRYLSIDKKMLLKPPHSSEPVDYKLHVSPPRTIVITKDKDNQNQVAVEFYGHNSKGESTSTTLKLKEEALCEDVQIITGDYAVSSRGKMTKWTQPKEEVSGTPGEEKGEPGDEAGETGKKEEKAEAGLDSGKEIEGDKDKVNEGAISNDRSGEFSDTAMWRWWRFNGGDAEVNSKVEKEPTSVEVEGDDDKSKPGEVDVQEILKDWYRWYM